jgi:phosphoribosylanthranilate isomerase
MTHVKICGLTSVEQTEACVALGAHAIGVNFVASSPRRIDEDTARAIVRTVGDRTLVVAVVAGMGAEELLALRERTGVGCLQLHGDDAGAVLPPLLPHAYAGVGVATADDVARAEVLPGEYVMVDAKVDGALGGTGRTFDWALVADLAKRRKLLLAGGLTPENVGQAVAVVHPFCVDVASGVEVRPGVKDMDRVKAFIDAVSRAE